MKNRVPTQSPNSLAKYSHPALFLRKLPFSLFLVIAALMLSFSHSAPAQPVPPAIIGTWINTAVPGETMEFRSDGKLILKNATETMEGSYTVKENTLTTTIGSGSETARITISDKEMIQVVREPLEGKEITTKWKKK